MAIQSRRGNISNFDKSKMLPGEWGIALDSQEAFICFGAGITKKMATDEDYADMMEESVTATENAKQATVNANTAVADFKGLVVNKLAINDAVKSTASGWSSSKIGTELDTTNAKVNTLNTSLGNQVGTASGASINLPNSFNGGLFLKELQGKSVQNGTPSPDAKVDIISVGDDGSVVVKVDRKNLIDFSNPSFKTTGVLFEFSNDTFILNSNSKTYSRVQYDINHLRGMTVILSYASKTSSVQGSVVTIDITYSLDGVTKYAQLSSAFTIPNNASNIYLRLVANDTSVANSNILTIMKPQLEVGTTSTTYEPYKEQLVTIPLTQPLRSVGSVYDRGCVKVNGLWGNERKFVTKTFDGSADEVWRYVNIPNAATVRYDCDSAFLDGNKSQEDFLCNRIPVTNSTNTSDTEHIRKGGDGYRQQCMLYINKNRLSDPTNESQFRAYLASNPITVAYELATSIFEPYNQSLQDLLNSLHTNQGVTNVFTTDPQQPIISVSYGKTDSSALALYASNVNDNKLDMSKIANNFVTTEKGFVAGAETVKILKDDLDKVNNNLAKRFITVTNGTFGTVALPHCYRIGDAITLQLDVNNITTTYGGWIHVGTLPLTEVPFNGVSCSCFDVALWTLHPINIESTGRIMINIPGAVSDKSVRIGGSYVI